MGAPATLESRFWKKVRILGSDECWVWVGYVPKDGYGRFNVAGVARLAHRVSYTLSVGPITSGMDILHACDNTRCVNPNHLRIGSHQDNMSDMVRKGRSPRGVRSGNSRLSEDDVLKIRQLLQNPDISQSEVGRIVGIPQQHVSLIKLRKRWGHL